MFNLERARATVKSVNLRAEKHGDDEVPAVDIKLALDRPSTDLAMFGPRLRTALFWRDPEQHPEDLLDGIDPMLELPNLVAPELRGPFALSAEYVGAEVEIDYGLGGPSNIVLETAKVNRLRVEPREGGSVELTLRVQASRIDEKIAGRLAMLIDRETVVSITAATTAAQDADEDDEREAA